MRKRSFLRLGACTFALAALLAVPASSQVLPAGIDVWTTPDDGSAYVDFTQNPLPLGFFCDNSPSFAQKIAVKGSPIVTNPSGALGSTDTVVERERGVDLGNGEGSTSIRVRAISFVNRATISVPGCSSTFSARVRLNEDVASTGNITIRRNGTSGGTFDASFTVPGKITFTNDSTGQQFVATETVTLQTTGAPWSNAVGSGGIAYPNPVSIDSDGNGAVDYQTPGTTAGFAPGWWNGAPVKVDHHGPHPTWPLPPPPPPPPCPRTVLRAVSNFEAQQAGTLSTTSTVEEDVTVLSSTLYAGQKLTLVSATDQLTSPCIAVTKAATYLVVDNQ